MAVCRVWSNCCHYISRGVLLKSLWYPCRTTLLHWALATESEIQKFVDDFVYETSVQLSLLITTYEIIVLRYLTFCPNFYGWYGCYGRHRWPQMVTVSWTLLTTISVSRTDTWQFFGLTIAPYSFIPSLLYAHDTNTLLSACWRCYSPMAKTDDLVKWAHISCSLHDQKMKTTSQHPILLIINDARA